MFEQGRKTKRKLKFGQRVIVVPYISCKKCSACLDSKENCCEKVSVIGVHQDGGFCEYLSVPEENLIPISPYISTSIAPIIETLAVSYHAVRRMNINPNDQCLIIGAGPIGIGAALIANAVAGCKIILADCSKSKLKNLSNITGITTLEYQNLDKFLMDIKEKFQILPNKIIDATGNPQSMNNTPNLIRHGGSILFLGIHKKNIEISDMEFHKKEVTLFASRNANLQDFSGVINIIRQIDIQKMITQEINFHDLPSFFKDFRKKHAHNIKTIVRVSD